MSERMDGSDLVQNAVIFARHQAVAKEWESWRQHVSRKYDLTENDQFREDGSIHRGAGGGQSLPYNVMPFPEVFKDAVPEHLEPEQPV